jgi:16S rRNA (cytidine1402-2'-O)-methyltransferase
LTVEVLPGASAILTALVASGLPTHAFYFGGFLPRKAGERVRALEKLATFDATLVFYESPRRAAATLASLAEALPGRTAVMARELTKLHEEVSRGEVRELAAAIAARELKGEVVLLVGPPLRGSSGEAVVPDEATLRAQVEALIAGGASRKDAVRAISERTGVARNAVYDAAIRAKGSAGATG